MKYNPKIHNRKSIRLKGYDYSRAGLYFITICVQNRLHLFGEIVNGKLIFNDAASMVGKWYNELQNKYPNIKLGEHIVMPNHFHCIIEIIHHNEKMDYDHMEAHMGRDTGTSLCGRPPLRVQSGTDGGRNNLETKPQYGPENKKRNSSIFDMMGWFKTMTTNAYIHGVKTKDWKRFDKRLWQL